MSEPIVSPRVYTLTFLALVVLTFLTVGLSYVELGAWHTIVGIVIAVTKAMLVALFFMGLKYTNRLNWMMAMAGLFWFGILMVMTLVDYLTRPWGIY